MAITVERMVAVLEARVDQFDKTIAKSRAQAVGDFGAITTAGTKMEASLARFGVSGKKGADAVAKSMAGLKAQTGNLSAQFNDIGVQLAGGQNPFLIAIQQGTQISQVLGQAGAKGAVSALGGAFLGLLNPITLGTIAAVALGGTVIQYFSSLISGGQESEATLKHHAEMIDAITTKWADTIPALKEYAEARKAAEALENDAAGVAALTDQQWQRAGNAVQAYSANLTKTLELLRKHNASESEIIDIVDAFDRATTAIEEHNLDAQHLADLQDTITSAMKRTAADGVAPYQQALEGLTGTLRTMLGLTASLSTQQLFEQNIKNSTLPTLDPLGFIDPDRDQTNRANATKSQTELAAEAAARRAGGSSSSAATNPLTSATQSIEERTKAAEAQLAVQRQLNPLVNDYGYALEFAKTKQELLTAAEKAKTELTPTLAADIDKVAAAYAKTTAELAKLAEENKKAVEAIQFQKDLLGGALTDMRTALEDGKLTWQDLGDVAMNTLNRIADKMQQMFIDGLFSQGGMNWLTQLLGGVVGAATGGTAGAGGVGLGQAVQASAPKVSPSALRRGAGPRGGSQGAVKVTVINNTPAQVRTEERDDGKGGRHVQFVLEEQVAGAINRPGSSANKALRNNFGVSPRLVKR